MMAIVQEERGGKKLGLLFGTDLGQAKVEKLNVILNLFGKIADLTEASLELRIQLVLGAPHAKII